jgi:hypothetical protein
MKMNNLHIENVDEKLKQDFGTENPFRVSDGYFEKLQDNLSARINTTRPANPIGGFWQRPALKPLLIGLPIGLVLFIVVFVLYPFRWESKSGDLVENSISQNLDSYIVGAAFEMPESSFYHYCTETLINTQEALTDNQNGQLDLTDIEQLDNELVRQYLENDPVALELVCFN